MGRKVAFLVVVMMALGFLSSPAGATEEVSQGATAPDCEAYRPGWAVAPFPVAFYSSETGFGGGAGGVITYRGRGCPPPARPQSLSAVIFYTAKGQSLVALAPELYFDDEAWELKVGLTFRNFPDRFYGVGRDTPEDSEEEYTLEGIKVQPWLLRRVVSHLYLGAMFDVEKTNILEVEEGGLLDQRALVGHAGGLRVGAGPVLDWDSRDNIFYPSRGSWYQCYAGFYRSGLGSDFHYDFWAVDLRRYLTLRPLHIVAFQVLATGRSGNVPFDHLARMGDVVRGIYAGRFQDRFLGAGQVEYRFPISRRFSGVLFVAAGDVSPTMEDFDVGELKLAGGAGLRFALNVEEKVNFRFDLGASRWGVEPYFQFSEAF